MGNFQRKISEMSFVHFTRILGLLDITCKKSSALNFSQFVGFQDSPNLSKIEKVAENRDFDVKETLIVKRAIAISKRVLA